MKKVFPTLLGLLGTAFGSIFLWTVWTAKIAPPIGLILMGLFCLGTGIICITLAVWDWF